MLLKCPYVDRVIKNEFDGDSTPTILKVQPDIIAIGDDWAKKDYHKQMSFTQEWLDHHNIKLIYLPYTKGISTTLVKKRIFSSDSK